jgi:hypothetical protein
MSLYTQPCLQAFSIPCQVTFVDFLIMICCDREDLCHLPICSVDPPGCKDIDDALHIRALPNGTLELGVHIADVTHFLHPGTAMDAEAASRSVIAPGLEAEGARGFPYLEFQAHVTLEVL